MAGPADGPPSRSTVEQLLLAGLGGLALSAERIEGLAAAIADRTGLSVADARTLVDEQLGRRLSDASRLAERAGRMARELGVASRDELDELRLQVAQLEHRLRLLES